MLSDRQSWRKRMKDVTALAREALELAQELREEIEKILLLGEEEGGVRH